MKTKLTILILLLWAGNCWAAELSKVSGKQLYKSTLGVANDEVVIGDELNASTFKPQIKFTKWNKENYLSIKIPDGLMSKLTPNISNGELSVGDSKVGFYFLPFDSDNFKFGIILKSKPTVNTWSFQLEGWVDFDFFYQPELTQMEIDQHCYRPPEVVGSYAIYHKTKKNYETGKINYATGKFGHIYRPKFIDADGKWVWGDLHIENGIYTITVSQDFLDSAVYPIKANDQFGLNTKGATEIGTYTNGIFYGTIFTNAPAGQITKAYLATRYSWRTGQLSRMAMYDNSNNLIANTDSGSMTITTTNITNDLATWTSANISSGFTMVAATTYRLAFNYNDTDVYMYYDTGGSNISAAWTPQSYANFPSDPAPTSTWDGNRIYSICYEYVAAGGAVDDSQVFLL